MNEEVLGTVDVVEKRKFGGTDRFLLCFAPQRMIAAKAGVVVWAVALRKA